MKKYDGIKTVGVVGAGTMGSAIAQHFLMKGLPVVLVDLNAQSMARGKELILTSLTEAAERKIIKMEDKAKIEARLQSSTELAALSSCQLIVEAVFEDFKVKNELFKTLETIVSDDCILASNTSSFAISDLGLGLKYPSRFLGVHYFYHAAKIIHLRKWAIAKKARTALSAAAVTSTKIRTAALRTATTTSRRIVMTISASASPFQLTDRPDGCH